MFGFLRGTPDPDPSEGRTDAAEMLAAYKAGDWSRLSAHYQTLAPSDRYQLVQVLGETTKLGVEAPTPADDPQSLTIMAGIRVGWAWRHRGYGLGASVGNKRANAMFDNLEQALAELAAAESKTSARDSVGSAFAIRAEMGLSGDRTRMLHEVQGAQHSGESNIYAALNHILFLAPKWHGSHEEMIDAARHYENACSAAFASILARAHIESWLFDSAMSGPEGARIAYTRTRDARNIEDVRALDASFWRRRAGATLTHAERVFAHNNIAFLLELYGQADLLAPHLEVMGPDIIVVPWGYRMVGSYRGTLRDMRRRAGLKPLR